MEPGLGVDRAEKVSRHAPAGAEKSQPRAVEARMTQKEGTHGAVEVEGETMPRSRLSGRTSVT